jgi:hypothetical protein
MAAKEREIKVLYDASMPKGGLPAFKLNFEQSLGVHYDEHMTQDGQSHTVQKLDTNRRVLDHTDLHVGGCMNALLGRDWRTKFEGGWKQAIHLKYEGVGSATMPGDLPYVSAALDVIAGLANARALERAAAKPRWIWDEMCTPVEIMGEGGFDIGARADFDVNQVQDGTNLAPGQRGPTVKLLGTRVHRNVSLRQHKRAMINKQTVINDLTGQLFQAIDDVDDLVCYERERKVADLALGIGSAAFPATYFSKDGLSVFPYQAGIWAAAGTTPTSTVGNIGTNLPSPQNQKCVTNYANAVTNDGHGFDSYLLLVRALQVLTSNHDPFTGLPLEVPLEGMKIWCAPAAKPQVEFLLGQLVLWQIQNAAGTTTGLSGAGSATQSGYDLLKAMKIEVVTSQIWADRVLNIGLQKATPYNSNTAAYQTFTNLTASSYNTANSILGLGLLGHFKNAIHYHMIEPFNTAAAPLGPDQVAEQVVHIQDFFEQGSAYWVRPWEVWRFYA